MAKYEAILDGGVVTALQVDGCNPMDVSNEQWLQFIADANRGAELREAEAILDGISVVCEYDPEAYNEINRLLSGTFQPKPVAVTPEVWEKTVEPPAVAPADQAGDEEPADGCAVVKPQTWRDLPPML